MTEEQTAVGRIEERQYFHPALQNAAGVISVLFHPVFIPVYTLAFLVYATPYFPAYGSGNKLFLLIRFVLMYAFFPLVTVALLKALKFIPSIHLKTQKDRIIPYIACGVYYFWMWYVLRNQQVDQRIPEVLVQLSLAIFIASSLGLIANSFFKISMHAISVGVMITFVLLMGFSTYINFGPYISLAFLIAGLVCTARLIHSDHSTFEVYAGLAVGIFAELLASWIY
jgi:hypothetical protein